MEKNTHTPRPLHLAQAEPLLRERLEATVVLTVTGGSMLPLLAGGRDRVTLGPVPERLRRGEVLLYRRADGSYDIIPADYTVLAPGYRVYCALWPRLRWCRQAFFHLRAVLPGNGRKGQK